MLPSSWARRALVVSLTILTLMGASVVVLLSRGWWPASPDNVAGLGATAERCRAAFGRDIDVVNGSGWDSARNVLYVKGAWFVYVGYNEAGRAEQFIFCKAKLPIMPSAHLSAAEQQTLLDRFGDGSTWDLYQSTADGPGWKRTDNKAFASYIAERRWLVIMDFPCLARKFKSLPGNQDKELLPPGVTP